MKATGEITSRDFRTEFSGRSVLVTGGGGFIGANLVRALLAVEADVHCLVRSGRNYGRLGEITGAVNLIPVDFSDLATLKAVFEKIRPEIIYHLAAYGNSSRHQNVNRMIETNLRGMDNLLEASAEISYRCFIHAGSSSEYGFKDHPMTENDLPRPMSYYAIFKLAATNLCAFHSLSRGKPIITLRLFSIYGPWEDSRRFIPTALRAALDGRPLPLTGGREGHDFVYVDDAVNAFLLAAQLKDPKGAIVNISTGAQYTNRQVVKEIERVVGTNIEVQEGTYPSRSWDTNFWVGDNTRAAELLGWRPRYSLVDGLRATANWLCQHGNNPGFKFNDGDFNEMNNTSENKVNET